MVKNQGALNRFFTQKMVADIVATLPKPATPLTDMLFPPSRRKQVFSPFVSMEEIEQVTGAMPLVHRDGASVPIDDGGKTLKLIEVDGFKLAVFASAKDINDLMALNDTQSVKAWITEKIEDLRNRISESTETLVRQSMTGKIEYPYATANGVAGKCEITLGSPKTITAKPLPAAAKLADLQTFLEGALTEHQRLTGAMGDPVFMCGKSLYGRIVAIVTASGSNAMPVVWETTGLTIMGKYKIRTIGMTYTLPGSDTVHSILADNELRIVDLSNPGKLIYTALDDLDANLAPLPFFAKPIYTKDPDGVKIVGESKPLPALAMSRQSKMLVTLS